MNNKLSPEVEPNILETLILLLTHSQLDADSEEYINEVIEMVGQLNLVPMDGTKMICSVCSTVNAPGYKLKRSAGKYLAFCVDEFGGCAGKEIRHKCNYVDHIGIECDQLAEYQIQYGSDELITRYACVMHTGILLKDTKNTIHPIT
jgi:hypothetical protein